jgi:hypothetical protein
VDKQAGCELCEAARFTPWYHEDDVCWVAECEACSVPMVVWNGHGNEPPDEARQHMLASLERVATELYGEDGYRVDPVMRQIPDHFHAHARRFTRWQ